MTSKRVGALLWILTLAYWPLQVLVAGRWPEPYSWSANYISDLGATLCGTVTDDGPARAVCSPEHEWWNIGLAFVGVLTALGAVLLSRGRRTAERVGLLLVMAGGLAVVVTAVVPFDVDTDVHDLAALAQFVLQILGMVVLAFTLRTRGRVAFAVVTLVMVLVAGAGFAAFLSEGHLGFGVGIVERVAFDTLTLWTVVAGLFLVGGRESGVRVRGSRR
ncbi:DUF998 domain-containing protein [Serinibacter arcticus]|uniref:DUF998 domain-containing protein n=1 Tax=Serinibacter arcticus TaxID=1655435 RepID=A0A2U1ZXS5_9MICO|nr:DUF998 domain-containing protein [Serinibacter arcticus]PWD51786.1 DUF998 domain-containing protein [Serinibacter arcticus]